MRLPEVLACDALVVGGGPAGAVLAKRLAALGYAVIVVERAASAAGRPGESLAAGILPILDAAGVREAVEALDPRWAHAALVRWSSPQAELVGHAALIVDRARLDDALLAEARRAGARVLRPALAGRPIRDAGGWRVPVLLASGDVEVRARFACDATGRRSWLGHSMAHRAAADDRSPQPGRVLRGPSTIALTAHLADARLALPIVEALPDAWLWAAPLPDGRASVMAFVDAVRSRADRARMLRERLASSQLLRRWSAVDDVLARDATPFVRERLVERDAICVGEAAFAIDPLSSQGVQAAIASALHAAAVVHTLLAAPARADAAMAFYRDRCTEAVARHATWAARLYADRAPSLTGPFWTARAAAARDPALPARSVPDPLAPRGADLGEIKIAPPDRLALDDRARLAAVHAPAPAPAPGRLEPPGANLGEIKIAPRDRLALDDRARLAAVHAPAPASARPGANLGEIKIAPLDRIALDDRARLAAVHAPASASAPGRLEPPAANLGEIKIAPRDRLALDDRARLAAVPCLVGDLVELVPALHHPGLERPVAYLGEIKIAPLIGNLERGDSAARIVERWAKGMPAERAGAILAWLVERGVLAAAPE